jgi:two-component system, NtrC family, sensor kinase
MSFDKKALASLGVALTAAAVVYSSLGSNPSVVVALLSWLSGVLVAVVVAHYALFQPMRKLVGIAEAVRSGDYTQRLRLKRADEIGSLAREMDLLSGQLAAAKRAAAGHMAALEQLRHSDRVATLGLLASSVAHELGNPLSVIELRAQLISGPGVTTLEQAQVHTSSIAEQAQRMTHIIDQILSFARGQPARIGELDLRDLLRNAVALSRYTSDDHGTAIELDVPASVFLIDGDAGKLLQIVVNLLINGVQSMPHGGTLNVTAFEEQRAPVDDPEACVRQYACIEVRDHGMGIPVHLLPRVFEPFFSTRAAEGGTGLGLSVAQGIAREHQGWISVTSELGHGSSFKVYLPKQHRLRNSPASCELRG